MNVDKRKKKHLVFIRSAGSLAGLIVVSGYLLLVLSAALGTMLYQSDGSGSNVAVILNSIAPDPETAEIFQGKVQKSAGPLEAGNSSINVQTIKVGISRFIISLEWNSLRNLLLTAFLTLWLGYMLRVTSILAETQLIDYQSVG